MRGVDDFFGPFKWNRILVVASNEPVDGFAQLLGRGEGGARKAARTRMLNQHSTILSQLAWVGVK